MSGADDHLIPLGVVTGFLGSGKTTLLNRLLRDPRLANSAVLVNELGEIGLDHWLLERLDADTVLLPSGCVCCTVRAELRDALIELREKRERGLLPPFRRVVLETTGLADPAPIAQTLAADARLKHHYALGRIVTVVDALTGADTLVAHEEAVHQAAVADLLVVSKTDLASPAAVAGLERQVAAINPAAPIVRLTPGGTEALDRVTDALLAPPGSHPAPGWREHAHDHERHAGIGAVCLTTDEPLDWAAFALWFTLLLHRHGRSWISALSSQTRTRISLGRHPRSTTRASGLAAIDSAAITQPGNLLATAGTATPATTSTTHGTKTHAGCVAA